MKVVQINAVCGKGSTGKICVSISEILTAQNIENYILYCSGNSEYPLGIKCASDRYIKLQALKSRLFGNYGFNSKKVTKRIISELERIQPDIVHLHNIHGHDCHFGKLLGYLKAKKIKLYWTFHDCWVFTGYCVHFDFIKCSRWKTGCGNCPQKRQYSWIFDRSRQLYNKKKTALAGLDLTIVTPSQWLADLVGQSFLKDYPVKVIHNGIDLNVFKPVPSDFREKHNISAQKHVLLGVAFGWGKRKGLDVFIELTKRLDQEKYQIVLVGTDDNTDKQLPSEIVSIHRTQNQRELAEIYTASELFVNPTREEVLGLVNIESLACGTPVLTFKTGGSPECVDEICGAVVDCDDIDALEKEIIDICEKKPFNATACIRRAALFAKDKRFFEQVKLYQNK